MEAQDDRVPLWEYPRLLAASRRDPVFYARHVLGVAPWSKQEEALRAVQQKPETAIRAANGTGKSFSAAVALSWWLDVHPPPNEAILTATTYRQAHYTLTTCKALRREARYRLPGVPYANAVIIGPRWHIRAFAAREPEAVQGPHAEHFLAVVDEASGVSDEIFPAIFGMMTTEHSRLLTIGNPNSASGFFARQFRRAEPHKITVSAYDTPNLVAGAVVNPSLVSPTSVARLIQIYGKDSDVVRVRVWGLPPRQDATAIIALADIEAAQARGETFRPQGDVLAADGSIVRVDESKALARLAGERFGGLDVARSGDDDCCLTTFRGVRLTDIEEWRDAGIDVTTARGARWLEEADGTLLVDIGGVGAGVYDFLATSYPGRVVGVDFGGAAVLGDVRISDESGSVGPRYLNRRTEMYYTAARFLRDRGEISDEIDAEKLERLVEELATPRGGMNSKGILAMEEKRRTKERVGRSPDYADAFVLGVAGILGGVDTSVLSSARTERKAREAGRHVDPHAENRWRRSRDFGPGR